MAENKASFVLYIDLIHTVEKLSDERAGKLLKHVLRYVNDMNPTLDDELIDLVFEPIKQQLKRDLRKWETKRTTLSENGRLGGIKSGESRRNKNEAIEANALETKQNEANEAVNVSVSVNVNELYIGFVEAINKVLGKKYRGDSKSKRSFHARVKEGYTLEQIIQATKVASQEDYHIGNGFKYLTPEFMTRPDKLEKFLQQAPNSIQPLSQPNTPIELHNYKMKTDNQYNQTYTTITFYRENASEWEIQTAKELGILDNDGNVLINFG